MFKDGFLVFSSLTTGSLVGQLSSASYILFSTANLNSLVNVVYHKYR